MTAIWTRPDGSKWALANLNDYESCFAEIDAEFDKAVADGRPTDAAQLASDRSELFTHYLNAQTSASRVERSEVEAALERCQLCLPWWQELFDTESDPVPPWEVSPAQTAIFAQGQIMPRTWEAAKTALELLPEYAPPPTLPLDLAISRLETLKESAIVLRAALDANLEAISKAKTDLRSWESFRRAVHPEYLRARTAFNSAAGALDATA